MAIIFLVDPSYAPIFTYLDNLEEMIVRFYDPDRHPEIDPWKRQLYKLDAVKKSIVADFALISEGLITCSLLRGLL